MTEILDNESISVSMEFLELQKRLRLEPVSTKILAT